jgi:formylmethanofuran dehydrogenase subunit E
MRFLFPAVLSGACTIALVEMLYGCKCWRCNGPFAIHQQHAITGRGLCWRCAAGWRVGN